MTEDAFIRRNRNGEHQNSMAKKEKEEKGE
jgi:hypothetical protein